METKYKVLMGVLITISIIIGAIIGKINYDYEVDKCNNLKTSIYDFNLKVEVNAEYSSFCYYKVYYPLAELESILMGMVMSLFISGMLCFIIIIIWIIGRKGGL